MRNSPLSNLEIVSKGTLAAEHSQAVSLAIRGNLTWEAWLVGEYRQQPQAQELDEAVSPLPGWNYMELVTCIFVLVEYLVALFFFLGHAHSSYAYSSTNTLCLLVSGSRGIRCCRCELVNSYSQCRPANELLAASINSIQFKANYRIFWCLNKSILKSWFGRVCKLVW